MTDNSTKSDKFIEAYQKFCCEAAELAIDIATSSAPQERCVELFASGIYRTCNYESHIGGQECITLRIPPLTPDDYYEDSEDRYYDDRTEELKQAFELACRVYDRG